MGYVGVSRAPAGCVFCEALSGSDDRRSFVLCRRDRAFLILNSYPYTPGHLMAVVDRHVGTLVDAPTEEVGDPDHRVQFVLEHLAAEDADDGRHDGARRVRAVRVRRRYDS